MEFIKKQSIKFNDLVKSHFIKQYRLKTTRSIRFLKEHSNNVVWSNNNCLIVSNIIVNSHYNLQLDPSKYSVILILYRNMYYKERGEQNICYLDLSTKKTLTNIFLKFSKWIELSSDAIIISRKYYDKMDNYKKKYGCFDLFCVYPFRETLNLKKDKAIKIKKDSECNGSFNIKKLKRQFLYNLKCVIDINTIYIQKIIQKSLFLDIEYINDIYDDFKDFPISKDTSLLCMIGMCYFENKKKSLLKYDNLIVKRLNEANEYDMLKDFLKRLDKISNGDELIIFHWSHADKTVLEKSLVKYSDLWDIYIKKNLRYVDLLKVVKKTIDLDSYSLKNVSKILLKYTYETECKNGLDAMCSIILNDQRLSSKAVMCNKELNDIIQYNKIDTQLLYVILKAFIS